MPSHPPPSPPVPLTQKIVVGIDYSPEATLALHAALGTALHRDVQIYAVTAAEPFHITRPAAVAEEAQRKFHEEAQTTLEKYLSEQIDRWERRGFKLNRKRVGAAVDFGDPAECILALAREVDADLIAVGTHGKRGVERMVLGSVAEAVLRQAPCPVLVLRAKKHQHA